MSVTSMITYCGGGKDFALSPKYPSLLGSISGPCNGLLFQACCGTHPATFLFFSEKIETNLSVFFKVTFAYANEIFY